jgi:hypothetical protein
LERVYTELNYFVPLLIAVVQLLEKKIIHTKGKFLKAKFKLCLRETRVSYTYCAQVQLSQLVKMAHKRVGSGKQQSRAHC